MYIHIYTAYLPACLFSYLVILYNGLLVSLSSYLSVGLYLCLPPCLPAYLSDCCLSVFLSPFFSAQLARYQSICTPTCLPVYEAGYLPIHWSTCLPVCLSVSQSACLPAYLSLQSIYLASQLFVYIPFDLFFSMSKHLQIQRRVTAVLATSASFEKHIFRPLFQPLTFTNLTAVF